MQCRVQAGLHLLSGRVCCVFLGLQKACCGVLAAIIKDQRTFGPAQGCQLHVGMWLVKGTRLRACTDGVVHAEHIAQLAVPGIGADVAEQALLRALVRQGSGP